MIEQRSEAEAAAASLFLVLIVQTRAIDEAKWKIV
jgi:hypothetical protein